MSNFLFREFYLSLWFKFKFGRSPCLSCLMSSMLIIMRIIIRIIKGLPQNHRPTILLSPITYQPTNRPPTTDHRPTDHRPNAPTTNQRTTDRKKFEDKKKFEFIFDINHDFKYRVFEIMLYIMHTNC